MNQKLLSSVVIFASLIGFISCQGNTETCITCTSETDANCLLSPGDMVGVACAASNNTCFTRIVNGFVVRGCLETMPEAVRTNCSVDVSDCETCIQIRARLGIPCNNQIFPISRLRCHQCEGHLNTTCSGVPVTNPTLCPLFSRNDECFIRRNGETVIRGCRSSPNSCPENRCITCSGDGCNTMIGNSTEIPDNAGNTETCITCTSETDANCLLSPAEMVGAACATNNNTCFTRIVNGFVVRGCLETMPEAVRTNCSVDVSDCETCVQISARPGVSCNNQIFPSIRLRCHQCEGHLNTTCGAAPVTNPTFCPLFSRNDECFIRRNGETVIRGCRSSPNSCPENRCITCSGDGCNTMIGNSTEIPDQNSAMDNKRNSLVLAFVTLFSVFALKKLF